MKTLEINRMESLFGGDCVAETLGAGAAGAVVGAITAGAATAGPGIVPGAVAGWLTGAIGGLIRCAVVETID